MGLRGELFSTKVALQNRTYFFNVKENRLGDLYLNIVESKNRETGGFERQSVILFADDLKEFLVGFDESLRVLEKAVREKRKGGPSKGDDRHGSPGEDADHKRPVRRSGQYRDSREDADPELKPLKARSPERKSGQTFSTESRFAERRSIAGRGSMDRKPTDRRSIDRRSSDRISIDRRSADRRSEGSSPSSQRPRVSRRAEYASKPTGERLRTGESPRLRLRQKPGERPRRPGGDRPAGKPRKRVGRRKEE
jgi:hypothetical protein